MKTVAQLTDIENEADVRLFVDAFYAKVRSDAILGIIFDTMARVDWDDHLPIMYQFWQTILLHQEGYRGNPIEAHVQLDAAMRFEYGVGLAAEDFDRWLYLFEETVDQMFAGSRAEMAKRGATRMGRHIQKALLI